MVHRDCHVTPTLDSVLANQMYLEEPATNARYELDLLIIPYDKNSIFY
jgi:hypothetical protein